MNMIEQRKARAGQGGFTLIELLVVVAILAILAGVAVFAVGNLTESADSSACQTEAETIKTAMAAADATPDADKPDDFLDSTPKYFVTTDEGVTWAKTDKGNEAGADCTVPT